MRRLVTPVLLALTLVAAGIVAAAAQTSPFGRGTPSTSVERKADAPSSAATGTPRLAERWFNQLQRWQSELTRAPLQNAGQIIVDGERGAHGQHHRCAK